jgi:hypothetical protein
MSLDSRSARRIGWRVFRAQVVVFLRPARAVVGCGVVIVVGGTTAFWLSSVFRPSDWAGGVAGWARWVGIAVCSGAAAAALALLIAVLIWRARDLPRTAKPPFRDALLARNFITSVTNAENAALTGGGESRGGGAASRGTDIRDRADLPDASANVRSADAPLGVALGSLFGGEREKIVVALSDHASRIPTFVLIHLLMVLGSVLALAAGLLVGLNVWGLLGLFLGVCNLSAVATMWLNMLGRTTDVLDRLARHP